MAAGPKDGRMWHEISDRVKKEECPHLCRSISLKNDLLAAIELRRLYNKYKPDVIHLHSSKAGTLGRIVLPRRKVVYTVHGFDSVRLAFRKFLLVERVLQFFCKAVVSVSDYDRKNLLHEKIKRNVITINNGIALPDVSTLQPLSNFDAERKMVLTIARVASPKRVDIFVDVARLLPQYNFVWIGNQREVTEYGELPANCYFLGNIPNAGAYCSKADMLMLSSNYEGLPMTILEAMSFGKPVVASNVGGISEIVINGVNGYTSDNDAQQFADKIKSILEDDATYAKMCHNSAKIFQERLTIDKMVQGYIKIYEK